MVEETVAGRPRPEPARAQQPQQQAGSEEPPPPRPIGRVPPHNLDAEEALLGAMMLSRDACDAAASERVEAADFYKPAHARVHEAITTLYRAGEGVDPVTVSDELRRRGHLEQVGGRQALLRLQAQTPASANASRYARIVTDLASLRSLIAAAGALSDLGFDDSSDVRETLDRAESMVFALSQRRTSSAHTILLRDALQDELDRMEARSGAMLGVPTGYHDLDSVLLGFQPAQLIVAAGRPGSGKSSLALGASIFASVTARRPVLFFSLEMSTGDLTQRALAGVARVGLRKIRTYSQMRPTLDDADWNRISRAVSTLGEAPLEIDDAAVCTVLDIRAKARRTKARYGDLGLIVVDYMQLMSTVGTGRRTAENRQVEVSEISRGLKILARELDVPVLALAQLNRNVEYRQDKRPMLADLRESGSLENDADVVLLLFRPEMYATSQAQRLDLEGRAEVHIAKHRNGPTTVVRLRYHAEQTRYESLGEPGPDPFEQGALLPPGG